MVQTGEGPQTNGRTHTWMLPKMATAQAPLFTTPSHTEASVKTMTYPYSTR